MVLPLILIGGAMAAAGGATFAKGMQTNTSMNGVPYGGSYGRSNELEKRYLDQQRMGQRQQGAGLQTLGQGVEQAQGIGKQGAALYNEGAGLMNSGQQGFTSPFAMGGANRAGAEQGNAIDLYRQAAMGGAPSAAQAQLQMGLDQSQRAMMGMAAAQRGGTSAGAMRNAMLAGAQMQGQMNQQAALLRAQEMEAARAGYAGASNAARMASLQQAGMFQNQQQLGLQQIGMGMGAQQYGANAMMDAGQFGAGLGMQREGMYLDASQQQYNAQMQADLAREQANQQARLQRQQALLALGGGLIGAGGNVMTMKGGGGGGGGGGK